jgi:hypothetical protein
LNHLDEKTRLHQFENNLPNSESHTFFKATATASKMLAASDARSAHRIRPASPYALTHPAAAGVRNTSSGYNGMSCDSHKRIAMGDQSIQAAEPKGQQPAI